jgi:hypothetical protein
MNFMHCTTCRALVHINNAGICLGCQRGFSQIPQEDSPEYQGELAEFEHDQSMLQKRKEEIEDALQEPETKSVPVRKQSKGSQGVRKRNTKRKKATKKS